MKNIPNYILSGFKSVTMALFIGLMATSCAPEGLINKVKYDGEKVINTCETFAEDLDAIILDNGNADKLVVAAYDNSDLDYYYLDPGQFEIVDGKLNFRFVGDLEYEKYLQKGVAIQVRAKYEALNHLTKLESSAAGDIGVLTVDQAYYEDNKEPFFYYSIPLSDDNINGKQVVLEFSVVKFNKKGDLKKEFCESVEVPLGPLNPSCCNGKPWEGSDPQSIVEMPDLDIPDESYRFKGFTGTLNFVFPESSTKFDKELLATAIQDYWKKYESYGYECQSISIDGYASMGGLQDYNQKLSEARSKAVEEELRTLMGETNIQVSSSGRGEEWNKFKELLPTSTLTAAQQQQALSIANGGGSLDDKEAAMRLVPFWEQMVEEVIIYTRHTLVTFKFNFAKDKMYVEEIPKKYPIISDELITMAKEVKTVARWKEELEITKGLKVLDILIGNNKKSNLYAMRSTYHFGNNDFASAIEDIDEALAIEKGNQQFALASLAYKTQFSSRYSLQEKIEMLDMYENYVGLYPKNRNLFFNRAVMMDKVGYISGALKEYEELFEGNNPTANQLNNRGVARMKTNRLVEAEADFQAAVSKDPDLAEAYFNMAVINAVKGLSKKAVANLQKATSLKPEMKSMIFSNRAFRVMAQSPTFDQFR